MRTKIYYKYTTHTHHIHIHCPHIHMRTKYTHHIHTHITHVNTTHTIHYTHIYAHICPTPHITQIYSTHTSTCTHTYTSHTNKYMYTPHNI